MTGTDKTNISFLSPYIHPLKARMPDGTTRIMLDCGIDGRRYFPDNDELSVLSVLWSVDKYKINTMDDLINALSAGLSRNALTDALERLNRNRIIFNDAESCDADMFIRLERIRGPVPLIDQVELTNNCVMRCGFCPRGRPGVLTRKKGFMKLELFERLLSQMSPHQVHYHPLELDMMGESLLHPQVDKFVELATHRALQVEMSVNPSLLIPELARRLVNAGITRIVLSLDGMDNSTLSAIRGSAASYDLASENIHKLIEYAEAKPVQPQIIIQMIDLERNRSQQNLFLDKWGKTDKKFVTAYVKPLDGNDPETGRTNEKCTRYLCTYPFQSVSVLWDGSVVPCCRDSDGKCVLGNINNQSLEAIWNSPLALKLRDAYRNESFETSHLCYECPWRRYRYVNAMSERHPDNASIEPMYW